MKTRKRPRTLYAMMFFLTAVLALAQACASKSDMEYVFQQLAIKEQELKQTEARLAAMEAKTQAALTALEKESQKIRDQAAVVSSTMDASRKEIRGIQGQMEESAHELLGRVQALETGGSAKALEARVEGLNERLIRVEGFLGMEAVAEPKGPTPSVQKAPAEKAANLTPAQLPAKTQNEKEAYARAKQVFDGGSMEGARNLFKAFLTDFPKSENADSALFWIGETYYADKWYQKAILEYQKVIEKYPKGKKTPAALLKQGMSFSLLGDNDNARLIFKELVKKYPKSREAGIAKKKLDEKPKTK